MVNPVGTNSNNLSGIGIYCNNIDVSKLSKEERDKYLEKMPNCTVVGAGGNGGGCCYPPSYYMTNMAKKRVHILTDKTIKSIEQGLDSQSEAVRESSAKMVAKLFAEDVTRKEDQGLNILLNKMLVNPYDIKVRSFALRLLTDEFASGNEDTRKILETLQNDPNTIDRHKNEIELALVRMNTDTKVVDAPVSRGMVTV